MVIFNHMKHKPSGSNASPLIKNSGSVPTCTTEEDDGGEVKDCNTSGMLFPKAPLLPSIILMTVRLSIKVRLLCQGSITRLQHRLFLYIKPESSFGLALAPIREVEDWNNRSGDCW